MTRDAVVAEALSWLGTKYHHHARVKGAGVDCAQLPLAVYAAVGLIEPFEPDYSPQWMLHRDEEQFLAHIRAHAREIERPAAAAGDLAVWRFGRTYSHSAILLGGVRVIHAMAIPGRVILGDMDRDADLIGRPAKFFTLFEGEG